MHRPMIQLKLNILSQAGLAKEDFSGATNTEIMVSYHIAGFFEGENFHEFHELIAICKNFTLEIFTLDIISISKLPPCLHKSHRPHELIL